MSNVSLTIGGRSFTVSAAPGEEAHIEMLGRMIDERVRRMGGAPGQSESRMMLFAALVLADELHEAHEREVPPALPPAAQPPVETAPEIPEELVARVADLAERIEKLAAHLEQPLARA